MKMLKIETFVDNKHEGTVRIPLALATIIAKPFLKKVGKENAHAIQEALNIKDYQGVILEVEDHQDNEKVVFSID